MSQPGGGRPEKAKPRGGKAAGARAEGGRPRRYRGRRPEKPPQKQEPTSPRWSGESGTKVCRKCGGRMHPADWIWQKYGLCLGWRCANCKEKVLARSLPFKGLRKRTPDPDEVRAGDAPNGDSAHPKEKG